MKIISSFSGGKTSAYMTIKLKERNPDLVVVFANTGQENNETLRFVHMCDIEFALDVVWLESVTHHRKRCGNTYKVVDFETADRTGHVYEDMIKKYGIPNKAYPHCTRELKLNPIKSWIKDNIVGDYRMAVGLRIDEKKRVSKKAKKDRLFYPLIDWSVSKFDVNEFWREQNFNLKLHEHQGNCKACFKKSKNKLLMIAKENPEHFNFCERMEEKYGLSGHNIDGTKRVFFRDNTSTKDLLKLSETEQIDIFEFVQEIDEDENSGCSESCEGFV